MITKTMMLLAIASLCLSGAAAEPTCQDLGEDGEACADIGEDSGSITAHYDDGTTSVDVEISYTT